MGSHPALHNACIADLLDQWDSLMGTGRYVLGQGAARLHAAAMMGACDPAIAARQIARRHAIREGICVNIAGIIIMLYAEPRRARGMRAALSLSILNLNLV
eukprot:SAG31_NODE_2413_length_5741_cov_8.901099_5_plen_101_part_00